VKTPSSKSSSKETPPTSKPSRTRRTQRKTAALLDIENDHLQRQYRLAVTTIRALAPD
jgi:hypothetical protein